MYGVCCQTMQRRPALLYCFGELNADAARDNFGLIVSHAYGYPKTAPVASSPAAPASLSHTGPMRPQWLMRLSQTNINMYDDTIAEFDRRMESIEQEMDVSIPHHIAGLKADIATNAHAVAEYEQKHPNQPLDGDTQALQTEMEEKRKELLEAEKVLADLPAVLANMKAVRQQFDDTARHMFSDEFAPEKVAMYLQPFTFALSRQLTTRDAYDALDKRLRQCLSDCRRRMQDAQHRLEKHEKDAKKAPDPHDLSAFVGPLVNQAIADLRTRFWRLIVDTMERQKQRLEDQYRKNEANDPMHDTNIGLSDPTVFKELYTEMANTAANAHSAWKAFHRTMSDQQVEYYKKNVAPLNRRMEMLEQANQTVHRLVLTLLQDTENRKEAVTRMVNAVLDDKNASRTALEQVYVDCQAKEDKVEEQWEKLKFRVETEETSLGVLMWDSANYQASIDAVCALSRLRCESDAAFSLYMTLTNLVARIALKSAAGSAPAVARGPSTTTVSSQPSASALARARDFEAMEKQVQDQKDVEDVAKMFERLLVDKDEEDEKKQPKPAKPRTQNNKPRAAPPVVKVKPQPLSEELKTAHDEDGDSDGNALSIPLSALFQQQLSPSTNP
jgi:hypothetical protein